MAKSKKAGRPPGRAPSVDQLIYEFLQRNNGSATWKKLKEVRNPSISDSALKAAIDRMVVNKRLTIKAEKVSGKTIVLYCLPEPILTIPTEGNKNFLQLVDYYLTFIEEDYKKDIAWGHTKSYATKPGGPVEEHVQYLNTRSTQAHALSQLIDLLGNVILDELGRYSQKESDAEAEQYIDAVIKTDLAVMIKNFAKLVSPRYGDAKELIADVEDSMEPRIPVEWP